MVSRRRPDSLVETELRTRTPGCGEPGARGVAEARETSAFRAPVFGNVPQVMEQAAGVAWLAGMTASRQVRIVQVVWREEQAVEMVNCPLRDCRADGKLAAFEVDVEHARNSAK